MAKQTSIENQPSGEVAESATNPTEVEAGILEKLAETVLESLPEPIHTLIDGLFEFVAKVHILHNGTRYSPGDVMWGIGKESGDILVNRGDAEYKEVDHENK